MKFSVQRSEIKKHLSFLQKTIPSKPSLPILSSIHLELQQNTLTLSATDLFFGVKTVLSVTSDSSDTTTSISVIPGKEFIEIISNSTSGELLFEKKDETMLITDMRSTTRLQMYDSSEYPDFPNIAGVTFSLPFDMLEKNYSLTSFSISADQARPVLNSLYFSFSPTSQEIVATDGFRLCVVTEKIEFSHQAEHIIPQKSMSEIVRIGKQLQSRLISFTYQEDTNQMLCQYGSVSLFIRLIDGDFPPYKKIIPSEFDQELVVSGEELHQALKKATVFSRDSSDIITFIFHKDTIAIQAQSPTLGSFSHTLPIDKQIKEVAQMEISFNSRYLLDFFSTIKPEQVWFGINDPLKPVVLKSNTVDQLQYIVMPFKRTQT